MIRKARMQDIEEIKELLTGYAERGLLLDRSRLSIYENVRDFFVAEQGGKVAGCCALHFCWKGLAEIRSLAVREELKGNGLGKALVDACLQEARQFNAEKVFTLSFTPEFFKKQGFRETEKEKLPHKIWRDCINCPFFPDCKETALEKALVQER